MEREPRLAAGTYSLTFEVADDSGATNTEVYLHLRLYLYLFVPKLRAAAALAAYQRPDLCCPDVSGRCQGGVWVHGNVHVHQDVRILLVWVVL